MRNSTFHQVKGNLSISVSSIVFSSLFLLCFSVNGQENSRSWDVVKASASSKPSIIHPAAFTLTSTPAPDVLQVKKMEDKVLISWTGSDEEKVSHYILELSSNGKDFRQAAVFFTDDESSEKIIYRFSEKLKKNAAFKYRLKVVGNDGEMVVRY